MDQSKLNTASWATLAEIEAERSAIEATTRGETEPALSYKKQRAVDMKAIAAAARSDAMPGDPGPMPGSASYPKDF